MLQRKPNLFFYDFFAIHIIYRIVVYIELPFNLQDHCKKISAAKVQKKYTIPVFCSCTSYIHRVSKLNQIFYGYLLFKIATTEF